MKARQNKCTWCWQFIEGHHKAFCSTECKAAFDKSFSCHFCGNPIEQSKKGLPSCKECAGILNDDDTSYCCPAGRAAVITDLYNHKYRNALQLIDWSHEELEEMGKNMRSTINKSLGDKYTIEARLAHLSYKAKTHTCENGQNYPKLQMNF